MQIKNPINIIGETSDYEVVEGDYTPTSNTTSFTITHNKGKKPYLANYRATSTDDMPSNTTILGSKDEVAYYSAGVQGTLYRSVTTAPSTRWDAMVTSTRQIELNTNNVVFRTNATNYYFRVGYTYHYKIYFKK